MKYDSRNLENSTLFEGAGAYCSNVSYLDDVSLDQLKVFLIIFLISTSVGNSVIIFLLKL